MGRLLMGKDISTMTQEEINDAMARMRAKRKNGNGRLGIKNPDAQMFSTNDFPIDGKQHKKFVRGTKYKHEHVKSIFVCSRELYKRKTAYRQTPMYLIGFLSDSNKVCFEEFRDYPSTQVKNVSDDQTYRVQKFHQMFSKKNIDSDTYITIDRSGIPCSSFIYKQMKLMCSFTGSRLKEVADFDILRLLIKKFKMYKTKHIYNNCINYTKRRINDLYAEVFRYVVALKVCPWITEEELKFIESLSMRKRHSFTIVELGLFYTVLRVFDALMRKSKKDYKEDQKSV